MNNQKIRVLPPKFCKARLSSNCGQEKLSRVNIFISGRVQGVFFRQFTQEKAQGLGLSGWVRNLSDRRVESLIEGDKEKIGKLLTYLKQGPPLSKVEKIEVNYQKHQGEFETFEIIK